MENLIISSTNNTPTIEFFQTGKLKVEGRSFSEDPIKFFSPVIEWCQQFSHETLLLEVKLDYLNTSSTKLMSEVIKTIDANQNIANKKIRWFFEEDDEDILEVGQFIEDATKNTQFTYHQVFEM